DQSFPLIDYFIAETYLHEGFTAKAVHHYQAFLKENKGENLVKDAYLKIYLCHYMEENENEAEKYKTLARSRGETRSEADKNAERLLNSSPLPNPVIFR